MLFQSAFSSHVLQINIYIYQALLSIHENPGVLFIYVNNKSINNINKFAYILSILAKQ